MGKLIFASATLVLTLTSIKSLPQSISEPYSFTHLAGNPGYGSKDGIGSAARFYRPSDVAVDRDGNIYVADRENATIRKVTFAGVVLTLAGRAGVRGSEDGKGSNALFAYPSGIAVDNADNLYVADGNSHTIRRVTLTGVVTTLAGLPYSDGSVDGVGSQARFNNPSGVAVDHADNIYVADTGNHTIRKITSAGAVTTLAGLGQPDTHGNPVYGQADGLGSAARFFGPSGLAVDLAGNVYVADSINHTIRKVTPGGGVTTLAGAASNSGSEDGMGSAARFYRPHDLAVDAAGNVYVADTWNATIRKVTPEGEVITLAGRAGAIGSVDGPASDSRWAGPRGLATDSNGNLYVADTSHPPCGDCGADRAYNTIRKITPEGVVITLAGLAGNFGSDDGVGTAARFGAAFGGGPTGVAVNQARTVFVADTQNHTIRKVTRAGVVTTLAGLAYLDTDGNPAYGNTDGAGTDARFRLPEGVAVDSEDNVYVADTQNHTIRKVTPAGAVSTLAGLAGTPGSVDGTRSVARFRTPRGVAADNAGNVYVADTDNFTIRKVTAAGVVTTLAGLARTAGAVDGIASEARFGRRQGSFSWGPSGVATDSADNVYVADLNTIRKVTPSGVVTTLAGLASKSGSADGIGSAASFGYLEGLAVDSTGNIYATDQNTIRKVTPAGVVTTLAGVPDAYGSTDGTGEAVLFFRPSGIGVDSEGFVYVADTSNRTIRKGYPASRIHSARPALGFNAGQFGFDLSGPGGQSGIVEASTDLMTWLPVWTNTFTGLLHFSDPQSGGASNRFYRARLP